MNADFRRAELCEDPIFSQLGAAKCNGGGPFSNPEFKLVTSDSGILFQGSIGQPEAEEVAVARLFNDEIIATAANHAFEDISGDPSHEIG